MGGNAGTQTMTVTVRALATRDLDIYNAGRIIRREVVVGLLNGVIFAVLIGIVAGALVPELRSRRRHCGGHGHQHDGGSACRHPDPAAARPLRRRPGDRVVGLRDHGDRLSSASSPFSGSPTWWFGIG